MDDIKTMLSLKNWAVVGATQNKSKFGYKVMKRLMDHGYTVYPVNPSYDEIEGLKCYESLEEINDTIDVVNMIVNPQLGLQSIEMAAQKGIKYIWCQPGADSIELIEKAKEKNLIIAPNSCVLVELD